MELRDCHVGSDVVWRAAILGHDQSGRKYLSTFTTVLKFGVSKICLMFLKEVFYDKKTAFI